MTLWKRVLLWTVAVALLAGVITYVAVVGTDKANQATGIVGSVAGVAALYLAIATEIRARRTPPPPAPPAPAPPPPAAQPPLPPTQPTYGGDHIDFSQAQIQRDAIAKKEEHHHYGPGQGPAGP